MGIGLGAGIVGGALAGAGEGMVDVAKPWVAADATNFLQQQQNQMLMQREAALAKINSDLGVQSHAANVETDIAAQPRKDAQALQLKKDESGITTPAVDQQIRESESRVRYNDGARAALITSQINKNNGASGKAATDAINRQAQVAASDLTSAMRAEKDDMGAPKYGSDDILKYGGLAARLVKSGGYSGAEAASIARSAPVKSNKELDAQLSAEEGQLSKVGMLDSGKNGDVKVGDTTMPIAQWRTQRRAQLQAANNTEIDNWAADKGLSVAGGGSGPGAPAAGGGLASLPDGTIVAKGGVQYTIQGGKPVPMGGAPDAPAAAQPWDESGRINAPAPATAGTGLVGTKVPASAAASPAKDRVAEAAAAGNGMAAAPAQATGQDDPAPPQYIGLGRGRRVNPEYEAWEARRREVEWNRSRDSVLATRKAEREKMLADRESGKI